jgi:hypothetical protein
VLRISVIINHEERKGCTKLREEKFLVCIENIHERSKVLCALRLLRALALWLYLAFKPVSVTATQGIFTFSPRNFGFVPNK